MDPSHHYFSIPLNIATARLQEAYSYAVTFCSSLESSLLICWVVLLGLLLKYAVEFGKYNWAHRTATKDHPLVPPRYPSFVPWLGHVLPFACDNGRFVNYVASFNKKLTSVAIKFLGLEFYVLQDWETVKQTRHDPAIVPSIHVYTYTNKYFFGIPSAGVAAYLADNTGPDRKPRPGSDPNISPQNRIHHITHQGFIKALTGPGMANMTKRYSTNLIAKLNEMSFTSDWEELDDLGVFFQSVVSESIIEAILGPSFLLLNPDFNSELWVFDKDVPWLARGFPSFLLPGAHSRRERLMTQIKRWYAHAREHFTESSIQPDGDADPFWGSGLMRYRQQKLRGVKNFDDDCMAASDLGLIWGAVSNIIPSITWAAIHIFEDQSLLDRVRSDVSHCGTLDPSSLSDSSPLLNAIFAETLRLHGTMYSMLTARDADASLGKWILPRGKIALISSGLSHMDEAVWNTREGRFPLNSFWSDRFLVYPDDPTSGPLNRDMRAIVNSGPVKSQEANTAIDIARPSFSVQGLEGSWIPYGAGRSTCPGKFFAKNLILHTSALLTSQFDIELLDDHVPTEVDSWSFGFNVAKPTTKVPFRIRKRS